MNNFTGITGSKPIFDEVSTSSGPTAAERKYNTLFDDYTKVCDELATARVECNNLAAEAEGYAQDAAIAKAAYASEVANHNVTKVTLATLQSAVSKAILSK